MIPLAIPAAPKVVPWRLVGAAAAVAVVAFAGWRVSAWKASHEALPGVREALAIEEGCLDGSKCFERQRALQEAAGHATVVAVESYEAEIAALRARPARVVRLCPAASSGDVRGAGPAAGTDGAGPAAGELPGPAGGDIGPDLYRLARDADEVAARLRALQRWNQALSTQPTK
jgi:hypothetical protein